MSALEDIRARVEAATPGPWVVNEKEMTVRVADPKYGEWGGEIMFDRSDEGTRDWNRQGRNDARFIAHAPEDIARLLAIIERITAVNPLLFADLDKDDNAREAVYEEFGWAGVELARKLSAALKEES